MVDAKENNYCTPVFVALDKWLNQAGVEKGDKALKMVSDAFQNNIKANVTYYTSLADEAKKKGELKLAAQNELLAKLYKELLK